MNSTSNRVRNLAFASIALNLFFLGFISAQLSLTHRPPFLPPFGGGPMGGHGDMPLFLREMVTPQQLQEHFIRIKKSQQKLDELLVSENPPTEQQLKECFSQMDNEMLGFKDQLQKSLIQRITTMSRAERIALLHGMNNAPMMPPPPPGE